MIRLAVVPWFAVIVAVAAAPAADDIRALVANLGSAEFTEREAAMKRLEELGAAALEELRVACRSENPEIARRAQELVRKIERKLTNEKLLAPTLVELDAKNTPLDTVLADLSKQSGYEVVLRGSGLRALAERQVTLSTGGKVPFWTAVLKVCEATDLSIAMVGGFFAPGASPLSRGQALPDVRAATNISRAIVLEPRDSKQPRRSAAMQGAVLIEAMPIPKQGLAGDSRGLGVHPSQRAPVSPPKQGLAGDSPTALLQVWPEPRLQWESVSGVKVAMATDKTGARLITDTSVPEPPPPFQVSGGGVVIIRNPDGTAQVVRGEGSPAGPGFTPNGRQALVKFKPGEPPIDVVKELGVTVFAKVGVGIEPLSRAAGLVENRAVTGVGVSGVELNATIRKNTDGRQVAHVTVAFDPAACIPATVQDRLTGLNRGKAGHNYTVHGVRVTDADGKPFTLGLASGSTQFDPVRRWSVMTMQLELHPDRDGQGPPESVTFWGTYHRSVEIAVTLREVPLVGGK